MTLQQLRYICAIARYDLNMSMAAKALCTAQPGISQQVKMLEEELGVLLFRRAGKRLAATTSVGQEIIANANALLKYIEKIKGISDEFNNSSCGSLSIATTHTQARYVLPEIIQRFIARYPNVSLHIHQGTPVQIAEMVSKGEADFAIATEALELFENLLMLPCYKWNRSIIVRHDHPLAAVDSVDLQALAEYPLVTYVFGFTGRSQLDRAFSAKGLEYKVIFGAVDADVIKTYVKLGLGAGIIASMAFDPAVDKDLVAIDAAHLFSASTTNIGFRSDTFLHQYMFDFIQLFAPHLTKKVVQQAVDTRSKATRAAFFSSLALPVIKNNIKQC